MRDVRWKLLRLLLLPLLHSDHLNQSSEAGRYWDDYEATDAVVVFHGLDTNTQTQPGVGYFTLYFFAPYPSLWGTYTHTYI